MEETKQKMSVTTVTKCVRFVESQNTVQAFIKQTETFHELHQKASGHVNLVDQTGSNRKTTAKTTTTTVTSITNKSKSNKSITNRSTTTSDSKTTADAQVNNTQKSPETTPAQTTTPRHKIRHFLQEVMLPKLQNGTYEDLGVDALMLEIKNFKNVNNLPPMCLLSQAIQLLLDESRLHKSPDYSEWKDMIKHTFQPFRSFWQYATMITDTCDRTECIFQVYEYCQNPKRPHLKKGFPYIISTLLGGDILCPVSTAEFTDAMLCSEEESERQVGEDIQPFLSQSCPW